ncbi:flagellar hook-associated protein FlgL [Granulosicoccus antarcticus]|uniref:Flagellar hook-associated protein 3 n=1 Tax=Granulosicoccus antarcticus IMCC3135 TaxID=1192854 RepID=A0A2Z2NSU0_9GAMM|nr:flagellar hook-associated protein FlgL [Granulosicoccus antarcticus]ASJ71800.1 Flagellar hook-associated protein 3 [Granulosicoccus antarcticus IMCC3135]
MINSRISSNVLASRIATDLVQKQNELAKVQTQISTGKRVNTPSDDPAQAAHIVKMQEAESQLEQYQRNASSAESQLALEESALTGTANILMNVRDLALSANSGTTDDYTRAAHDAEAQLALSELYDLANSRDSFGNFLFGGSNTETPPFTSGTQVTYNGNSDAQQLTIGLGRTIQTGDSGIETFMRIPDVSNGSSGGSQDLFATLGKFIEALGSSPVTETEKAAMQQTINDTIANLDSGLDHINTARARVGTRLNSVDNSREENANISLQIERTRSEVEDIDIAEAITSLQTQTTSLEILQQTYSSIQSLSMFNYI